MKKFTNIKPLIGNDPAFIYSFNVVVLLTFYSREKATPKEIAITCFRAKLKRLRHRKSNVAPLNFTRSSVLTQVNGGGRPDRELSDNRDVITMHNLIEPHCGTPLSHIVFKTRYQFFILGSYLPAWMKPPGVNLSGSP